MTSSHLESALGSIDAALKAKPRDHATLKHARSLVQRVHSKNTTGGGYEAAIERALSKPTTKG